MTKCSAFCIDKVLHMLLIMCLDYHVAQQQTILRGVRNNVLDARSQGSAGEIIQLITETQEARAVAESMFVSPGNVLHYECTEMTALLSVREREALMTSVRKFANWTREQNMTVCRDADHLLRMLSTGIHVNELENEYAARLREQLGETPELELVENPGEMHW